MQAFFEMGGYADYVWPAYGVAALILAGLLIASLAGLGRRKAELERLEGVAGRQRRS